MASNESFDDELHGAPSSRALVLDADAHRVESSSILELNPDPSPSENHGSFIMKDPALLHKREVETELDVWGMGSRISTSSLASSSHPVGYGR